MSDQGIVDQELAQQLVDRAKAEGVKLTGPGGLLGDLTKRVLEAGLEGEMDRPSDSLTYAPTPSRRSSVGGAQR